jgi:hypothetical protein
MTHFEGSIRLVGERGAGLPVHINLTDDHHLHLATDHEELGDWPITEIAVTAKDDGFHLRAEGDEIVIRTSNDAEFALAMGIRNAPTLLRRQMSELMRNDPRFHGAQS